jgi:Protein of unknown function (DUF3135)
MSAATQFCFSFDFDEWATLARNDPSAFEARRLELIEDFLRQFPPVEQRRLRGLQFRIEMERRRARTPMAACLRLSAMMWDSLLGNHGLKDALDNFLGYPSLVPARVPAGSAHILPFRKPSR